jgi:hypothetical protein
VLGKFATKVKSGLRPLLGSSIHDGFKLGFITLSPTQQTETTKGTLFGAFNAIIMESKRLCKAAV